MKSFGRKAFGKLKFDCWACRRCGRHYLQQARRSDLILIGAPAKEGKGSPLRRISERRKEEIARWLRQEKQKEE